MNLNDNFMVPDINQKKWEQLIQGKVNVPLSSYSLQIKVNSLNRLYRNGFISIENAVKELYEMCKKYPKIYEDDLKKIFKN
jgi:hypothetical protein